MGQVLGGQKRILISKLSGNFGDECGIHTLQMILTKNFFRNVQGLRTLKILNLRITIWIKILIIEAKKISLSKIDLFLQLT